MTPHGELRILAGHPDDAEVAAVTLAVLALAARASGSAQPDGPSPVSWGEVTGYRAPTSWLRPTP